MDIQKVKDTVVEIRKYARSYPERSRDLRDDLYRKVLRCVARGDFLVVGEYVEIAKEALKAERIKLKWEPYDD